MIIIIIITIHWMDFSTSFSSVVVAERVRVTKDKKLQSSNENAMNLLQNSQYLWNIFVSRRSIWVLLAHVRRWTQHFNLPKSTRKNVKLNKSAFGTPWLPDLLCKHWFTSSVWNFCRWVADVPSRETSLSRDERGETSAVSRLVVDRILPSGWACDACVTTCDFYVIWYMECEKNNNYKKT